MTDRIRWWLVLLMIMAVVAAAGVVIIRWITRVPEPSAPVAHPLSTPAAPAPGSPTPSPVPTEQARRPLAGAGDSVLVVQTARAIYRVVLATGHVEKIDTPELDQHSSFVAGRDWIVFKTIDNDPGVVVGPGRTAEALPAGLRPNGRLYLTNHDDLWLVPEDPTDGARTAVRVTAAGQRVGASTIRIPDRLGLPESDLAGQLMVTTANAFYQASPSGIHRLGTGQLLGANAHQVLSWDCDRLANCAPYLLDRSSRKRSKLPRLRAPLESIYRGGSLDDATLSSLGALSPDGTTLAAAVPGWNQNQPWPIAVVGLDTGRTTVLPGSHTDTNPNAQFAWSRNSRYLFAITDQTIRVLDVRTHRVSRLTVTDEPPLHLIVAGQPSN